MVAPSATLDPRAEHHVRLDGHVAAELGIVGEPHAFGVDQGCAFVEHLLAAPALPFELEMGELGAAVDPRGLIRIAQNCYRLPPLRGGDVDDVREVKFSRSIVVADLAEPAEQVDSAHRHHARIAQANRPLLLGRVLIFDHLGDAVALPKDDAAIFQRVVGPEANTTTPGPPSPFNRSIIRRSVSASTKGVSA